MKILKTVQKGSWRHDGYPASAGCDLEYRLSLPCSRPEAMSRRFWSSGGANTAIAIFPGSAWAQILLRQGGQISLSAALFWLFAKFLAGAGGGWVIGAIFGTAGVLGLPTRPSLQRGHQLNGGLFMSLAGTFGDDTDIWWPRPILNINDGPFLTLVAVGASA